MVHFDSPKYVCPRVCELAIVARGRQDKHFDVCVCTGMQENVWARLRESRPDACLIHAT